ncbi:MULTISPECIES: hypothetical protein [unclassified Nitratiruptor]|uniref:hypothetical protein n=1 Tax=unclassified Nitratiruptor TaxID=2624044 RepID=UPI0019152AC2|nr:MULTISPECIES: hypothetical protein [unclassified Nitratiruptor]BCD60090.1 hypothetical protein NitYY0810_C0855 [Nitratiruptor sp. YY08-10]BCD64421.1 hypothetical protein NitYY0814_C1266 [Nitratiruptor sp. YY08-14]
MRTLFLTTLCFMSLFANSFRQQEIKKLTRSYRFYSKEYYACKNQAAINVCNNIHWTQKVIQATESF